MRISIGGLLVLTIGYNGLGLLRTYRTNAHTLTQGDLELIRVPRVQGKRIVLPLLGKTSRNAELTALLPLLTGKLTHPTYFSAQYLFDWKNDRTPVLLLQKKRDTGHVEAPFTEIAPKSKTVWVGSEYVLLDPGMGAKEVYQIYQRH